MASHKISISKYIARASMRFWGRGISAEISLHFAPLRCKDSKNACSRGFTLIEMLVVIGLVVIVAGFSVVMGMDSFRGDSYRAERDTIIILLQQARTESLNNIDEAMHGVAFFPNGAKRYVEFSGDTYLSRDPSKDVVVDAQYAIAFSAGAPTEIVFEQLSGDSNYSGTFSLIDTARNFSSNITITSEGGVSW